MKQICLFTATGAENLGDELITLCEIRHFQRIQNKIHITIFSHNTDRTKRFLTSQGLPLENITIQKYFPDAIQKHPLKNIALLWETYKTLKKSEHVYIGGGGLLYGKDDEWHSPLLLWWLRTAVIKFLKKPLTYLSLGISVDIKKLKTYAGILFSGATITVRDRESLDTIQRLWYDWTLLPDPVFTYERKNTKPNNTKIIGIAFREGFISPDDLKQIIKKMLAQGYEVLLLPHSLHPWDEQSHDGYYLQNFLLPGVMTSQSIEQTLVSYEKCHIIIAMRLHSMILAIDHLIPFIGVSYGKKTNTLLSEASWEYTISPEDITVENTLHMLSKIEKNYDKIQEKLTLIHSAYQQEYDTWINSLLWK